MPSFNDGFDRRVPIAGGIERGLHCPEAVALEDDGSEAERLRGNDGSLDVLTHIEEVIGVHMLVVLSRADC